MLDWPPRARLSLSAKLLAVSDTDRCHYCECKMVAHNTPEGVQYPDRVASRDHTVPACDGGAEIVLACVQCNQIKASDSYEIFLAFMAHGGRAVYRHERKKKYREFRRMIMDLGLRAFTANNVEGGVG